MHPDHERRATAAARLAPSLAALLLVTLAGCARAGAAPPTATEGTPEQSSNEAPAGRVLITHPSQRQAAVGRHVTILGLQTRTKIPQVNGVDVDGDYELSDRRVRVDGILQKHVVEPRERDPDEPAIATRGPGTYYSVVDPKTGELARTRPE